MSKKFYLKDWHGKEKEFTDEKIFVRGEDGELIQFTQGEGDKPAVVQPLEVTESGTYTAPDGVDGYSPVTVNVQGGGGGGSLPAGIYWEALNMPRPSTTGYTIAELNGELYAFVNNKASTDGSVNAYYKWENGAWTSVAGTVLVYNLAANLHPVEYGGKLHFCDKNGATANHYTFDGTTVATLNPFPSMDNKTQNNLFVQNEKLKYFSDKDFSVYVWNDATDTWTKEATLSLSRADTGFYNAGGVIYASNPTTIYTYNGASLTQVGTFDASARLNANNGTVVGGELYFNWSTSATNPGVLYRYDKETNKPVALGYLPMHCDSYYSCFAVYQGKLAFLPYTTTSNAPIIVMHEVTE